jgi:hypothetical protein
MSGTFLQNFTLGIHTCIIACTSYGGPRGYKVLPYCQRQNKCKANVGLGLFSVFQFKELPPSYSVYCHMTLLRVKCHLRFCSSSRTPCFFSISSVICSPMCIFFYISSPKSRSHFPVFLPSIIVFSYCLLSLTSSR